MSNTLTLNNMSFMELNNEELLMTDGGLDWGQALQGVALFGATLLAVASAPVSVPAAVIFIAGTSGAAYAGYLVGTSW